MTSPLRLYFDLAAEPHAKLLEWDRLFNRIAPHANSALLVDQADDADVIVHTRASSLYEPCVAFKYTRNELSIKETPRHVVWDKQDSPTGLQPGLYCSLPSFLYDTERHRTAPYPFTFNRFVKPFDLGDGQHLLVFHGGITHPIRRRAVDTLVNDPRTKLRIQGGGGGLTKMRLLKERQLNYAESLRRSKFFLCPRGVGVGSIRLFETLRAARVPVIVADAYVLPTGVDWDACSIIVAEHDIDRLVEIVETREQDWPAMAIAAYREWSARYSDKALLDTLAGEIRAVGGGPGIRGRLRVLKTSLNYARSRIVRRGPDNLNFNSPSLGVGCL